MTSIYTNLIGQIQGILDTVKATGKIKEIFAYPATKINKYPAAIFFPASFENSFENSNENKKVYRFKLFIVVGAKQTEVSTIFATVLPNAVDAVVEQFDADWSLTSINGHRTWIKIDSGDWTMAEDKDGLEATAELNLEVKLLTNNN